MPEAPILVIRHLSKDFPGVRALPASISSSAGRDPRPHGENGAGKSTLIKVLTGVYPRDGGEIQFEGRPSPPARRTRPGAGHQTVYQEVNLVPNLSVAENLLLDANRRAVALSTAAR